ncbi:class I SAM-dependent methyltransferase [Kitasatospora sp. NPDC002227]|uniref:class I SAM-dependent methyltransferase n=1 Tax=Kitasatospora sp. NPDC002227 TaxID=3154773 RepID=UPI00332588E0
MDENRRERLRTTFTEDAELYDRARPGYPAALYAELARSAGLGPGCRVLEIGCGTGKATVPLAAAGALVTAVELGPEMAAVAERNLAPYPAAEVRVGAFEAWPLPAEPFDLVLAATAFHWIDPAVRVVKAARALRPGGALAVFGTHHVRGGDVDFFTETYPIYDRFDPDTPPPDRLMTPGGEIPAATAELTAAGLFGPPAVHRWEWDCSYSTRAYLDVLLTYSNHRALPDRAREGLLTAIAELIDTRYGGRVTKRYMTELTLAERLAG